MTAAAEFCYRHRYLILAIVAGLVIVATADGVLP